MPKRFTVKLLPVNVLEVGEATIQTVEVDDSQICLVYVKGLIDKEVEEFRDTWEKIVGNEGLALIVTNYEVDIKRIEIVEVDPPTRYEREPVI
jgi:hypothetical protein